MLFHILTILSFLAAGRCQNSDIYWGSYELTIPGGSGSGNAVQHLNLPENAPEFFQFSALKNGPAAAPTFPPPAPLQVRPQLQPASQPSKPQQLEVFTNVKPSPQQRLAVLGSQPDTTGSDGSASLSRFQLFQLRQKQQAKSEDTVETRIDQKNLDDQKPVRPQRRLRKVAIRRRKPQNKE